VVWGRVEELRTRVTDTDTLFIGSEPNAERKFMEDLIAYLDYKIREGDRIRNERKQLSFWK
jgi:hypothetical protein